VGQPQVEIGFQSGTDLAVLERFLGADVRAVRFLIPMRHLPESVIAEFTAESGDFHG